MARSRKPKSMSRNKRFMAASHSSRMILRRKDLTRLISPRSGFIVYPAC
jgi:hypothetical protein